MAGRPLVKADLLKLTTLTIDDADWIFAQISEGRIMYKIAETLGVGRTALMQWIEADPERVERLKRARERSASALVEEALSIADNGADTSAPDPARDKLRVQVRQWTAARLDRSTWGEQRVTTEVNVNNLFINAMRNAQPVDTAEVIDVTPEQQQIPEA